MKFKIIESKWLRGGRDGEGKTSPSQLLDKDGHMCCMGFLAEACGVPRDALDDACYWSHDRVMDHRNKLPEVLLPPGPYSHGKLAQAIYDANDANLDPETAFMGFLSDSARKAKLTALFAEAGIEVEFVP